MVRADDCKMFYSIFVDRIAIRTRNVICGCRSTKNRATVWIRNINERKFDELGIWNAVGSDDYQDSNEFSEIVEIVSLLNLSILSAK